MSYTKHTWTDGELVTAAKMNNIENGIEKASSGGGSGGVLVVHRDENNTLDKTWSEIDAADVAVIVFTFSAGGATVHTREFVTSTVEEDGAYSVAATGVGTATYETDSADGYPVRQ